MNSRPRKGRTVDDTSAGVEGVAPDFLEQLAPAQAEVRAWDDRSCVA